MRFVVPNTSEYKLCSLHVLDQDLLNGENAFHAKQSGYDGKQQSVTYQELSKKA